VRVNGPKSAFHDNALPENGWKSQRNPARRFAQP
jgi:hypothetical protein